MLPHGVGGAFGLKAFTSRKDDLYDLYDLNLSGQTQS